MQLFDSHTHLNHHAFEEDRDAVWERAKQAGVVRGVVVGWDLQSSRDAVAFAKGYEELTAAVGVSPHDAAKAPGDYLDCLRELARESCVTAIGEIGLEYHHPVGPKETQRKIFREQLDLAAELGMPVVIHNRDADPDLLEDLSSHTPPGGVLHCYTSGVETMQAGIRLGLHISLSGIVTFKKMGGLEAVAQAVPDDRLLIETDCPYLAPVPHRGKRCEPAMVERTLHVLAECRKTGPMDLARITFENAAHLFGSSATTA